MSREGRGRGERIKGGLGTRSRSGSRSGVASFVVWWGAPFLQLGGRLWPKERDQFGSGWYHQTESEQSRVGSESH